MNPQKSPPAKPGSARPRGGRRFLLDEGEQTGTHYFLLAQLRDEPPKAGSRSVEQIARVLSADHPWHGEVKLTSETFQSFITNFENDTWGQEVYLDLNHMPSHGVLAKFTKLFMQGDALMCELEWTQFGVDEYERTGFRYFSIDFTDQFRDPETGTKYGALLFGAGLVPRPFIKRMPKAAGPTAGAARPESLTRFSLDDGREGFVPPWLQLSTEIPMKAFIKKLKDKLIALKLADAVIAKIVTAAEAAATKLGDQATDAQIMALLPVFEAVGEQTAQQFGDANVTITIPDVNINAPSGGQQLSDADIDAKVAAKVKQLQDESAAASKQLADSLDAKRKTFNDAIDAAEGIPDDIKTRLKDTTGKAITPDMTDEAVKTLSDAAIEMGNQAVVGQMRLGLGMIPGAGAGGNGNTTSILMGADNSAMKLHADIQGHLRGSTAHVAHELRLEDPQEFAKRMPGAAKVLALFDQNNAHRLSDESKRFADGRTDTSHTELPAGWQRQVIQEALSDLNILNAVTVRTDPNATSTTDIPYEYRDKSAIRNHGRVYERQPIHRAGVIQKMDTAYIQPIKLALEITNEVRIFSRTSGINFDAYARNVAGNARAVRELVQWHIANELQRAADTYGAMAITNEDVAAKLDGSNDTIKLAQFPLVRPHQDYNLRGETIGSVANAIVIDFGGTPVLEWDGSGTQAAGTYYRVVNYNLAYIQFVDESGDPVTPDEAAATISYSYSTNVAKFDLDEGATELSLHLNGIIRAIGSRKAVMSSDRFVMPTMGICSPTLQDTISNAKNFEANSRRPDADMTAAGVVDMIKQINFWNTNAPDLDLGDERILLGQAGLLNYVVKQPFVTGAPYEIHDSTGAPLGTKGAYGEEYSAIKVPGPTNERLTSVIAYSATARAAVA